VAGVRALMLVALCGAVGAGHAPAGHEDVKVASGTLAHHFLTNDLFRIDKLWMQVTPGTLFHRWLSQGINGDVEIILTASPEKFGDRPNVRILSGTLIRGTAPQTSPIVHNVFLHDERTGSTGP
jgi:hypothetical protein